MDYCGVRARDGSGNLVSGDLAASKIDYDILQYFRTTGLARPSRGGYPNGPPPAAYDVNAITSVYKYNLPGEADLIWPAP